MPDVKKIVTEAMSVRSIVIADEKSGQPESRNFDLASTIVNVLRKNMAGEELAREALNNNGLHLHLTDGLELGRVRRHVSAAKKYNCAKLAGVASGKLIKFKSVGGEQAIVTREAEPIPVVIGEIPSNGEEAFPPTFGLPRINVLTAEGTVTVFPFNEAGERIVEIIDLEQSA